MMANMHIDTNDVGDALIDRRRRSKVLDFRREQQVAPIYSAIVVELERKRQAMGISQDEMSELMGSAERSYSKMIHADTPSGRQATWPTVQKAIDVLFCDGFDLVLRRGGEPLTSQGTRRKILASAAHFDRKTQREIMAERGRKGGLARAEKLTPEQRVESAKRASAARWENRP